MVRLLVLVASWWVSLRLLGMSWVMTSALRCDTFFYLCYLPAVINATAITLVPKLDGVERLLDFNPISCCNVVYKCITKLLSDQLQGWLPKFVSSKPVCFCP